MQRWKPSSIFPNTINYLFPSFFHFYTLSMLMYIDIYYSKRKCFIPRPVMADKIWRGKRGVVSVFSFFFGSSLQSCLSFLSSLLSSSIPSLFLPRLAYHKLADSVSQAWNLRKLSYVDACAYLLRCFFCCNLLCLKIPNLSFFQAPPFLA